MKINTILAIAVLTTAAIGLLQVGARLPIPYRTRLCQGFAWHRAFPEDSTEQIREFLALVVSAYAFRNADKLRLSPDDQVMEIYRALYPSKWMPDTLELESLASDIRSRYQVDVEKIWKAELTLGELFIACRSVA